MKYAMLLMSIFLISCDYNSNSAAKEKYEGLQSQIISLEQRVDSLVIAVNDLKPKPTLKASKKKKTKQVASNNKSNGISTSGSSSNYNWKVTETETPNTPAKEKKRTFNVRVGARCCDGSRSYATGRGACSHHGGVCEWLYE